MDDAVAQLVTDQLAGYEPQAPPRPKAIHDALWGTQIFSPAEIDLLDTPILQRLRGIHQTSFAFLTFPSATHSRFEHSLGVVFITTRMATSLNQKEANTVTPCQLQELRIAALLHDCSHGIFSHISEQFYGEHESLRALKNEPFFQAAKPAEILAYKMITSSPFRAFFEKVQARHKQDAALQEVDIEKAAGFIIAQANDPEEKFLASIINGPFDADKLDYIARDSYFTGLKLVVDIDRLLYALEVADVPTSNGSSERRLVIYSSGASVFEQILYSKVQLHSLMYRHPKVRAADLMLISFLRYMKEMVPRDKLAERFGESIAFDSPTDFLRFRDYDLLNEFLHDDPFLKSIIQDLRNRRLMRKALVLSSNTVAENFEQITRILGHEYREQIIAGLAQQIQHDVPSEFQLSLYDIVLDLPPTTPLNEATLSVVRQPDGSFIPLNQLFPSDNWLDAYVAKKWRGHVFYRGSAEAQKAVGEAAKRVLEEELGIKLHDLALGLAAGPAPA